VIERSNRLSKLQAVFQIAVVTLCVRVLIEILAEYRWYFPLDFEQSSFLSGRRSTFIGIYPVAFFAHLVSAPLALLIGALLMISGSRSRFRGLHRSLGKIQILIVLCAVVPSGVVMARQAYAGPIAAAGFLLLAIATGVCAVAAVYCALTRRFRAHQKWATRCFILLVSPLLLRLIGGATIVLQLEPESTYRMSAWISWLAPLAILECWWSRRLRPSAGAPHSETVAVSRSQ
jgi:hypothetical protein